MKLTWKKLTINDSALSYLRGASTLDHIDPQALWADLTFFQYSQLYGQPRSSGFQSKEHAAPRAPIPVIFELKPGTKLTELLASLPQDIRLLGEAVDQIDRSIYAAFVRAKDLIRFSTQVLRWRVGLVDAPVSSTFTSGKPPNPSSLPDTAVVDKDQTLIGIIDHGIPFANPIYHSRIERFWNQQYGVPVRFSLYDTGRSLGDLNLKPPRNYNYGWEMDQTLLSQAPWWNEHETDAYRKGWVNYRAVQGARSHASHVMGVLTGNMVFDDRGTQGAKELADYASKAPIVAVQLPAIPTKDTSGNTLCVHVFNAVNYILQQAVGRNVVINLSDGSYAGPHDGSSLLERGIDELLLAYRKKHYVQAELVVAAGNQFHEAIHWKSSIQNGQAELTWRVLPDDTTDGCLELWFEKNTNLEKVKITLTSPSGQQSIAVSLKDVAVATDTSGNPCISLNFSQSPGNAIGRSALFVHWGPSRLRTAQSKRGEIEHGIWHMTLTCEDKQAEIMFDAYIERDDPAFGDPGPRRQAFFEHRQFRDSFRQALRSPKGLPLDDATNKSPVRRLGALNSIATAAQVKVAGAFMQRPFSLSSYTAGGPGRNGYPFGVDAVALADDSAVLHGILAGGVRSGSVWRMNGTSVAAPKMSRELINRIASGYSGLPASGAVPPGPIERHGGRSIV